MVGDCRCDSLYIQEYGGCRVGLACVLCILLGERKKERVSVLVQYKTYKSD